MNTKKHYLALDLKDDPDLMEQYKQYHAPGNVWPEVIKSIGDSGIVDMEIYLTGNRLFMAIEVDDTFDFEQKGRMDADNPKVQEWEVLMMKFQKLLPWARDGEKWVRMERIFKL